MPRLISIRALPGFRLWLEYSDGICGEVDLSHLVGKGVFGAWRQPGLFESVRLGDHGAVEFSDSLDLCPDALYLTLTGKSVEEVFGAPANA
jgi:hypothetical protein